MLKKTLLSLALLASVFMAGAQTLTPDPTFRTGKLPNGLTYYIRHNAKEAKMADFYIAQRVGSILEEPRQRGLAHFLEHMAFNGSQNFLGTEQSPSIVHWCESVGIKFGANLNASTSVDQTIYHVSSVPVARTGVLDSTLLILHDWSHYLLLSDREIDKERGVIHEEWRTRRAGMAVQRMMENVLPEVYRNSKYEDCLPIGSMDIVDHFPYQDLRDYYQKWYRPDLQAVIIVGDIDVDEVEQKIRRMFGPVPMPKNPAPRIYYPVPDNEEMIVAVDSDPEQPIMLATLHMKREATPDEEKNTEAYVRGGYVDDLIRYMLNGRLQEMQQQAVPPCLNASVRVGQFFISRTKDAFALSFGCRQENIRGSFLAAIGVAERARQFGFTEAELGRAKALQLSAAERHFAERNDRRNNYFVHRALQDFTEWEPMIDEQTKLQLIRQFGAEVTLDQVNRAVRDLITNRNQVLVVYTPQKEGFSLPSKDELRHFVEEAQQATYEPYKEEMLAASLIDKLPKAGRIVSEKASVHGSTEIRLSNGVTVYVKPTTFSKDQIQMRFWGEGGTQLYPDADEPNFSFISQAITGAGAGRFDETTLRKMLAGKIARVTPSVSDEVQSINGTSSVKDLKTMLELTWLYATQPRRDDKAFHGQMDRMRSFLTNREANPQVSYNDSIVKIAYGNSPRVQPTKLETLDHVSYDRILQIYKESFANVNGFKMLLVGNIDLDQLRPLLCQYVASLPSEKTPRMTKGTKVYKYPDVVGGNKKQLFKKQMKTPSASVTILYTFQEPFTPKADLALDFLDRILSIAYTDSVREEKGGVYGVSVDYSLNPESTPTALLKIKFRTDPAKYDMVMPIIDRQISNIAQHGPLTSSMDKVKEYLLKSFKQNFINNGYWDHVLYNYLRYGIDYHTECEQMVRDLTPADVQKVATDLLSSRRRIEVTMLSE